VLTWACLNQGKDLNGDGHTELARFSNAKSGQRGRQPPRLKVPGAKADFQQNNQPRLFCPLPVARCPAVRDGHLTSSRSHFHSTPSPTKTRHKKAQHGRLTPAGSSFTWPRTTFEHRQHTTHGYGLGDMSLVLPTSSYGETRAAHCRGNPCRDTICARQPQTPKRPPLELHHFHRQGVSWYD
jgi:hypothetical protein